MRQAQEIFLIGFLAIFLVDQALGKVNNTSAKIITKQWIDDSIAIVSDKPGNTISKDCPVVAGFSLKSVLKTGLARNYNASKGKAGLW